MRAKANSKGTSFCHSWMNKHKYERAEEMSLQPLTRMMTRMTKVANLTLKLVIPKRMFSQRKLKSLVKMG